jgi:hypothetical protein
MNFIAAILVTICCLFTPIIIHLLWDEFNNTEEDETMSESELQKLVRIKLSQAGCRVWRNNVGVAYDGRNVPIRFGLANESAAVNKMIKSSDLIGITPHLVSQEDIGRILGIFTSIECKYPGWKYEGTAREQAQLAWINIVISLGGIGKFVSNLEEL